ncbi:uncharacterized protein LOC134249211 [Saccostrea cucullata]|uniref:uncharacterized protein LOC134249211 n=1 Tax=Saccostrea cuccullata TaxID=36930 RepID=UPI002ED020F4
MKTQLEQERAAYRESASSNNESTEALKEQVRMLQLEIDGLSEKSNSSDKSQRYRDLEKENERLRSEKKRLQKESGATILKLRKNLQAAKKEPGKPDQGKETNKDKGPPISAKRPQTERKAEKNYYTQSTCSRNSAQKQRPKIGSEIKVTGST